MAKKMDDSTLKADLKALAFEKGINLFGVASATPWSSKPGHSPVDFLSDAQVVLVMATPVPHSAFQVMPLRNPHKFYSFSGQILKSVAYHLAIALEDQGHSAVIITSGDYADRPEILTLDPSYRELMIADLSLKYAAVKAGIGVIGKSGLVLNPDYGSYISLIALITTAPLNVDHPLDLDLCGECTACIHSCYTGALQPDGSFDPVICQNDPTGKFQLVGYNYLVCPAACRISCPIGKSKAFNKGAILQGADPFKHIPYNTLHRVPPRTMGEKEMIPTPLK